MRLQVSLDQGSQALHALPIHAEIAVAGSGGGTKVKRLGLIIEDKLDIVYETKQEAGEFIVEVGLVFLDELRAGEGTNDLFQRLLGLRL
jgi:hypothetical protein